MVSVDWREQVRSCSKILNPGKSGHARLEVAVSSETDHNGGMVRHEHRSRLSHPLLIVMMASERLWRPRALRDAGDVVL